MKQYKHIIKECKCVHCGKSADWAFYEDDLKKKSVDIECLDCSQMNNIKITTDDLIKFAVLNKMKYISTNMDMKQMSSKQVIDNLICLHPGFYVVESKK